jgi:hypothetical protein
MNHITLNSKRTRIRTWYGIDGTVTIGSALMHKSGIGNLIIPHPAIVNWLLRLDLPENCRSTLRILHELGHLQSAPLAVAYTAANYAAVILAGRASLLIFILVLISTHAAWEIMAEIHTIMHNAPFYHGCYERVSAIPRAIFWFSTIALALMGWIIVLL